MFHFLLRMLREIHLTSCVGNLEDSYYGIQNYNHKKPFFLGIIHQKNLIFCYSLNYALKILFIIKSNFNFLIKFFRKLLKRRCMYDIVFLTNFVETELI